MSERIKDLGIKLITHDISNALTHIKGYSSLMKETKKENWKEEWIEHIYNPALTIEKLALLANGYTNLGKDPETIKVGEEFQQATEFYPELKEITLLNQCQEMEIRAHQGVVAHLFYNLIHNSLRHGEKVSRITMACKEDKEKKEIIYKDNGKGVTPEEKEIIFEKGFSKKTSLGLGLYIIDKICEYYGWKIKEKGIYGKGAEFIIVIKN